jgi:hypothetical protein
VRTADNPPHHQVPIVLKSGSLKLVEPPGSLRDCTGIALRFNNASTSERIVMKFGTRDIY